ncbi:hypothetical protein [Desertivirga arenae]|uniref:hypothetical protein n=1 Tax=Desertivirga arenae TaxID=2810309 RepID=UPI001A965E50|nr:hypothetical protein [Pedobacter sp. SYSU D00823]
MRNLFYLLLLLMVSASTLPSYAQQANPNNIGSVKGLLQDTVHKYSVKSATVSLYMADSTLINYSLSNTYGEFVFKNLPLNNNYYIEVSHISYNLLRKSFSTSTSQPAVDLKTLVLKPREVMLKDVVVGVPPVQMNGDTLEFNASAFKLDSNAVVEDLLRKIPNITLWGDGLITVNGREVKSLLVNGKEFFGGDLKMATQNISKNALQKIQVYNTQKDQSNPLDSSLTMNLKLKKAKDRGHFGKIGGGYGTNERFEGDGSLNFFSSKMQLGFIGATNNTNKIAGDIRALTANSTFKGTGINVEYQPDFRATGINRTNTGGGTFSYNFIEKPTYQNKSELTANYFIQNRDHDVISNSLSATTTNEGNSIFTNTNSSNNTLNTNQTFDSRFSRSKQNSQLNISQRFSNNNGEERDFSDRTTQNQSNDVTSTNQSEGLNNFANRNLSL